MNNEELTKRAPLDCREVSEWVLKNLNPHQALIITHDGVKVVSDDCFIPMQEIIK